MLFVKILLSILFGTVTGLLGSLLFALLVRFFLRYMNRTPILDGPVIFSPKIPTSSLQLALTNQTHLLGSSPCGQYLKTQLDNNITVAVKKLEPFQSISAEIHNKKVKRKIQQQLETLANIRHRNLMCLRAYIYEHDRLCLVYDYVPTGSLEDAMIRVRDNQLMLSWEIRLKIAIGIVKGLQYLHFTCNPRILHHNLKPTNVLLDAEFEPRLTDSCLSGIISISTRVVASGYNAPESIQSCRYTDKSDVYSFGVILGVLLSGKSPMDPLFLAEGGGGGGGGGCLGGWLRHLEQCGEGKEAIDKSILGEELEEEEMVMALRIAVVCLSDLPADRPSTDELVSMLTQLNSF